MAFLSEMSAKKTHTHGPKKQQMKDMVVSFCHPSTYGCFYNVLSPELNSFCFGMKLQKYSFKFDHCSIILTRTNFKVNHLTDE